MSTIEINSIKDAYKVLYQDEENVSFWKFVCHNIFNFYSYCRTVDFYFMKKMVKTIKLIKDQKVYEYITNFDRSAEYGYFASWLNNMGWIDWGISIRGAWLDYNHRIIYKNEVEYYKPSKSYIIEIRLDEKTINELLDELEKSIRIEEVE